MGRLEGKTAVVTGASKGVGEAIAHLFAQEGATMIIGSRTLADVQKVAESIGPAAIAMALDVGKRGDWQAVIGKAREQWGRLDILVNCAGAFAMGSIEDTTDENWRFHMSTNLDGVFYGCQAALPLMKASGKPASIVNVGSGMTHRPSGGQIAYVASKTGMVGLTKCLAQHCALNRYNVRVNIVHPGGTETPMFEKCLKETGMPRDEAYKLWCEWHPMGRIGKPMEAAEAVLWLASDASSFTTGTEINVDGGVSVRP